MPLGHRRTTTVTAALRTTGLVAISLFEGATNGQRFLNYVADTLVPTLRPGDTVVLDNLCVHKVTGVCEAVEAAGARLLFLPPAPSRTCTGPSRTPSPASPRRRAATTSSPLATKTMQPSQPDREQH